MIKNKGKIRCKDCGKEIELIDIKNDNRKGTVVAYYVCPCNDKKKQVNTKFKTALEAQGRVFLMLCAVLLGVILTISFVYALDFKNDNKKTFEKGDLKYGKIIIWDTGQIGGDKKVVEITLLENSDNCGITCYAQGTIIINEKINILDKIRFNKQSRNKKDLWYYGSIKEYKFFIKQNGNWVEYNNQKLNKGTYEWRLEGKKNFYETVDWLATFYGYEIDEWALWAGVDAPTGYWTFNDSSGTIAMDSTPNSFNGTINGAIAWNTTNSKLGESAITFHGITTEYVNITRDSAFPSGNFTFSIWINSFNYADIGTQTLITTSDISGNDFFWTLRSTGNTTLNIDGVTGFQLGNDEWEDYKWQHLVLKRLNNNITLWKNGTLVANATNAGTIDLEDWNIGLRQIDLANPFNGSIDEIGIWNRSLTDEEILDLWNNGNGLTFGDVAGIEVILNEPQNSTTSQNQTITFNSTLNPSGGTLQNATFYVWFTNESLFNKTTITSFTTNNHTILNFSNLVPNNYLWNVFGCEDIDCAFAASNFTFNYASIINTFIYNDTFLEGTSQSFIINATVPSGKVPTNGILNFNGTNYSATITSINTAITGDEYKINSTISIPAFASSGNKTINMYWNFSEFRENATALPYVNSFQLGLCNETLTTKFLNITFQDEDNLTRLNASIPNAQFVYYTDSISLNKTFTYINNTDNFEYDFCATPNVTINVIPYLQYKKGIVYPQRIWSPAVQNYSNVTINQVLYLLESADGQYVTIQVINSADQVISGVAVNATRTIDGSDTIVGTGNTGSDGTITFWLNPDFSHIFSFSKTGYTDYTTTFAPTQSSYTITLAGGTAATNSSIRGINYWVLPTNSTLFNDTDVSFIFNLTSSYWDVSEYGFSLRLANGTIMSGGSTGVEGTPLTLSYNVNNQTIIYMDYYWVIEGAYTNASRYWVVINSELTGWSIANLFIDLKNYMDYGFFGIDDFGKYFIVFIIMFVSVGIMSYKFGLTSPLTISTLTFGIIFFFDVVVDMIPSIRGINNLLTYLAAVILVMVIFREIQT